MNRNGTGVLQSFREGLSLYRYCDVSEDHTVRQFIQKSERPELYYRDEKGFYQKKEISKTKAIRYLFQILLDVRAGRVRLGIEETKPTQEK